LDFLSFILARRTLCRLSSHPDALQAMFTLRQNQIEALDQLSRESFVERMLVHLNRFFPEHCRALGDASMREAIDHGIERAETYGIVNERDVCLYIDLMFGFGRDFDTDPELPWAAEVLNDEQIAAPKQRINRLHEVALEEASRAGGG